jgi:predicted nucleic acid-binding protein
VILADTSVWVTALRRRGPEAAELDVLLQEGAILLAAPVRIELLAGASRGERARLRRVLSALPIVYPGTETWRRLDDWLEVAAQRGERFGFADLLIAALAAESDAPIWSLDADFVRLARLGLIRLHRPRSPSRPNAGRGSG